MRVVGRSMRTVAALGPGMGLDPGAAPGPRTKEACVEFTASSNAHLAK